MTDEPTAIKAEQLAPPDDAQDPEVKWTLSQRFSEAVAAAGIADVTLHTLRHTFATRLKDAGVDPFTVRDLLGHATIQMTNYYTHATPGTMRRGVQALSEETRGSTRIVPERLREIA